MATLSMTSLPGASSAVLNAADIAGIPGESLAHAFTSFTEVAASLERSYAQLHAEVARLRHELEETNRDLARSLEENRRVRRHLDRILEGLPCGVVVLDVSGQISIMNPEARRLLGAEHETLITREDHPWLTPLQSQLAPAEREYKSPSPTADWISVRQAELETGEGRSSIFILRDITEARRLEQLQAILRRREALAEMSAVLAHEIRNPLGSLELFAGLLTEAPLEAAHKKWAKHVQAGIRTLAATVNNVLQFHSGANSELRPLDMGELLESFTAFLDPVAELSGVEIHLTHSLRQVMILADRHRLEQVLFNLALNAIRFMPEGGVLKVGGQLTAEKVTVAISDTGQGITPENLEHIFDSGFTTRRESPGLGLAVCKAILEQHAAQISVASRMEQGTTFTLEFRREFRRVEHVQ
jgi:two-component system sensor histidine kinase FlrB